MVCSSTLSLMTKRRKRIRTSEIDLRMGRQDGPKKTVSDSQRALPETHDTQGDASLNSKGSRKSHCSRWRPKQAHLEDNAPGRLKDAGNARNARNNIQTNHPRRSKRLCNSQQVDTRTPAYQAYHQQPSPLNAMPLSSQPSFQSMSRLNSWSLFNSVYPTDVSQFGQSPASYSMPSVNHINAALQQPHLQHSYLQHQGQINAPPWNGLDNYSDMPSFFAEGMVNFTPSNPAFAGRAMDQSWMPSLDNGSSLSVPLTSNAPNEPGTARSSRPLQPPKIPAASAEYLAQASVEPRKLPSPQPLLVILDLNGTLIYRKHRRFPPQFAKRAGLDEFLKTLIDNYTVMIWSSSQPLTVGAVCEKLFPTNQRKAVIAEWARDKFGLSKSQYKEKIQVYKRLQIVWADEGIQSTFPGHWRTGKKKKRPTPKSQGPNCCEPPKPSKWDQSNTILIDDSKLKALSEPYNILEIPEFTDSPDMDESQVFPQVLRKLKTLARHDDVSKVLRRWSSTNQDIVSRSGPGDDGQEEEDPTVSTSRTGPSNSPRSSAGEGTPQGEAPAIAAGDTATAPTITADMKQARKERRKARKQTKLAEKRARKEEARAARSSKKEKRRKAAAATSTDATAPSSIPEPVVVENNVNGNSDSNRQPDCEEKHAPPEKAPSHLQLASAHRSPSPSPVSSAGEDNGLLDRLEESLGLTDF